MALCAALRCAVLRCAICCAVRRAMRCVALCAVLCGVSRARHAVNLPDAPSSVKLQRWPKWDQWELRASCVRLCAQVAVWINPPDLLGPELLASAEQASHGSQLPSLWRKLLQL